MKLIVLFIAILMCNSYCYSCGCDTTIGLKEAKSVFEGTVIEVHEIYEPYIRYEITFKIRKVIKGKIKTKIIVVNVPSLNAAGCGIPFEVNDRYRVFTYMHENMLYSDACTETRILDK